MILIRLKRQSLDDKLTYSIVVSSSKLAPSSGKFIEKIGYYHPLVDN
jgi:ribosomal protein S16